MSASPRAGSHIHVLFFFSSRRRHTSWPRDWSSDVCSSDLARLRNLDGRQMDGEVELTVPVQGRDALRLRREVHMAGGSEQTVTMRLALPGAQKWEPWRFGAQPMYRAEVVTRTADGVESSRVDEASPSGSS